MKKFILLKGKLFCAGMLVFIHVMSDGKQLVSAQELTAESQVVWAGNRQPAVQTSQAASNQAVEIAVSGTVTDGTDGSPLPGVNVFVKGTATGTTTDASGKYRLNAPDENAVLVFSFIGYAVQEVVIGSRSVIDIALLPDIQQLSEVVVIGYGEVEREDLTTSISSISSKQLKDIPINSAAQALSGRLAGVQVIASEGSPDAEVLIRVRGGNSITQNNSPLFVVDGIQVENALSVLAPQDIESVNVLKDASATAIYGARGANGVVIITTKGGREMKTVVNYNGLIGVKQLANKLDVMKPYDFVVYQYERSRGNSADEAAVLETYGQYDDFDLYRQVPFVDWQDETFGRTALMQTHNISAAGGTRDTQFNLSISSNNEEGIMLGSDFDRKLVNFRFDHTISPKLKTGFNVRYNNTVVNGSGTAAEGSSSVNRLRHSVKYRPILFEGQDIATYDADYADETRSNSLSLVNPVLLTQAEYKKRVTSVANLNGYVSYDLTDYLSFRSTVGVDITNLREDIFNDSITTISQTTGGANPIASVETQFNSILNNSNVLTFSTAKLNPDFAARHKIDVLVGHEIFQTLSRRNFLENQEYPRGISAERALALMRLGTPQIPQSSEVPSRLLSFFSRANYALDDKYLLALTVRADGSSKFPEGKKWGYFPSASAAWKIINENFMQGLSLPVSDLKLRVSYGQAGNNRIDDFLYLPLFEPNGNYSINEEQVVGYGPADDEDGDVVLANANLKWETTISRNIGLDAGFFNNRLQFSVDVYSNSTRDLLVKVPIPSLSGYLNQIQNVGETSNRGVEFQVSGTPVYNDNFGWNVNFNMSFNRNNVESLGRQESFLYRSGWGGSTAPFDYTVMVGKPVGAIWGLTTDGFYTLDDFDYEDGVYTLKQGIASGQSVTATAPRPGSLKFADINGDTVVNDLDRSVIGNASPKFFGGINQQFTYKNFDLSVFINFQYGNDVLNANKLEFTSGYTIHSNLLTDMNNRWRNVDATGEVVTDPEALRKLNEDATIWSPLTTASSFYPHTWAVEDGSFIRINNITLGYTLPASLLSKWRLTNFRVYGTVNNLAVFTKYSGYDPEVNTRRRSPVTPGVDYSAYPRSRGYIFGINLTF